MRDLDIFFGAAWAVFCPASGSDAWVGAQCAVETCIQRGILKDFLTKYRNEAIAVSIFEYNEELALTYIREDEYQKGHETGKMEGKVEGETIKLIELVCKKLKKGKPVQLIAEELEEEPSVIAEICKIAGGYKPEYDCDKIYEELKLSRKPGTGPLL